MQLEIKAVGPNQEGLLMLFMLETTRSSPACSMFACSILNIYTLSNMHLVSNFTGPGPSSIDHVVAYVYNLFLTLPPITLLLLYVRI